MGAPGMQDNAAELPTSTLSSRTGSRSAVAAAANRASVLAALSAAQAARAAACLTPEMADLIDQFARIFAFSITVSEREMLAVALTDAIDARITAVKGN